MVSLRYHFFRGDGLTVFTKRELDQGMEHESELTVRDVVDGIGRRRLADALGHRHTTAICNAITAGIMPADWEKTVRALAPAEIPVADRLFKSRGLPIGQLAQIPAEVRP